MKDYNAGGISMHKLSTPRKWNLGLATDEAVLVGIMLSSAGTFGAVSLSWENMYTSVFDSPQSIVGQLHEIEQANAMFQKNYAMWPTEATDGNWAKNVAALADKSMMRYPYNNNLTKANVLKDVEVDMRQKAVMHSFGDGGRIMQREVSLNGEDYLEVIFENVPISMARQVDEEIDGGYTPLSGKISLKVNANRQNVNIHYIANKTS